MDAQALVDPAPVMRMALFGAALALVPLAWTAWRHRARQASAARTSWLRALTLTTLVLTFDLVLFGAFTRLTDSGLGCPDWPGCYGHASPLGAKDAIDAAVAQRPDGPVTHGKAWIEMIHRYFAMVVGALIVLLTIGAWRLSARARGDAAALSPWWATLTLAWVLVQGAFGALTVTMRLYPAIVTLHLLLGMGLLALLAAQAQAYRLRDPRMPTAIDAGVRTSAWLAAIAITAQIALGGWVSTNYAVLACQDFPTCQGAWWPPMDFEHAFTLRRALGRAAADAGYVPFAALTAIHVTHRLAAIVVAVVVAVLALRLVRAGGEWQRTGWLLLALLAWQVASGVSNVVLGWPIVAALAHVAGAAGIVVVLAGLLVRLRGTVPSPAMTRHGAASTA